MLHHELRLKIYCDQFIKFLFSNKQTVGRRAGEWHANSIVSMDAF